jgi:hypothetical protein
MGCRIETGCHEHYHDGSVGTSAMQYLPRGLVTLHSGPQWGEQILSR